MLKTCEYLQTRGFRLAQNKINRARGIYGGRKLIWINDLAEFCGHVERH